VVLSRAVAAAAVVALAACGSGATGARSSPTTSVTTTSSMPGTSTTAAVTTTAPTTAAPTTTTAVRATTTAPAPVALGVADDHRTVQVARGTAVSVDLRSQGQRWSEPQSTDQRVLTRTSGAEDAQTGEATAMFTAAATGSAQLQATGGALCPPDQPCPMYAVQWSVTIEVH
jgi:hypothetical protein